MNSVKNKTANLIKGCKILKKQFPGRNIDFYRMFISVEILRQLIDNEWVNQTVFKHHGEIEKKNKDAFEFFRSSELGYVWQTRICFFAERMYNLRETKNFDLIVKEILNGNLVSRYAEIEIGAHLLRRGINFEFVEPTGEKTKDYDLKIVNEIEINCEVKHKIESTELSINTLKNTLSDANKQLPKNELGIIFLKIPQKWSQNNKIIETLKRVLLPFFKRNNSHIIAIVLRWEVQDDLFENLFRFMYKVERNIYFETNKKIDELLNKIENQYDNNYWVSLAEIVMKHINPDDTDL